MKVGDIARVGYTYERRGHTGIISQVWRLASVTPATITLPQFAAGWFTFAVTALRGVVSVDTRFVGVSASSYPSPSERTYAAIEGDWPGQLPGTPMPVGTAALIRWRRTDDTSGQAPYRTYVPFGTWETGDDLLNGPGETYRLQLLSAAQSLAAEQVIVGGGITGTCIPVRIKKGEEEPHQVTWAEIAPHWATQRRREYTHRRYPPGAGTRKRSIQHTATPDGDI